MAKDSCHDAELMRLTLWQTEEKQDWRFKERFHKESGTLLHSWEPSYGISDPQNTCSHAIHNRHQNNFQGNTKWTVISYEQLQLLPEMAETRNCWSGLSLMTCQKKRIMIRSIYQLLRFTWSQDSMQLGIFSISRKSRFFCWIVYCSSLQVSIKIQTDIILSDISEAGCVFSVKISYLLSFKDNGLKPTHLPTSF